MHGQPPLPDGLTKREGGFLFFPKICLNERWHKDECRWLEHAEWMTESCNGHWAHRSRWADSIMSEQEWKEEEVHELETNGKWWDPRSGQMWTVSKKKKREKPCKYCGSSPCGCGALTNS